MSNYIKCDCRDPQHFVHTSYDGDAGESGYHVYLGVGGYSQTIWERVRTAYRILFGKKSIEYTEIVLTRATSNELISNLGRYEERYRNGKK